MRSGARVGYDSVSMNVLEPFGMVWTADVMITIRKGLPRREGEAMLMRGDNSSVAMWVSNHKGGTVDLRAGGLMRVLGALEIKGRWCSQVKHMAGVDNSFPGLIIRCERNGINVELTRQRPNVNWREQMVGEETCSVILRGYTRSDVLRCQLEELTSELRRCE